MSSVNSFSEKRKSFLARMFANAFKKIEASNQKRRLRKQLERSDFSIISNNCWGGVIYQKYGLKYTTPTVGLYILGHDFVKFASDLGNYLKGELEFIPWEQGKNYSALKNDAPYPIARLKDIEIYFMHYSTQEEAAEKWYRRAKRVNYDHLIFKLSQREACTKEDIEVFMHLPLNHRVCFAYDRVPGTLHIPELKDWSGDEMPLITRYYDELPLLNEK